MEDLGTKFEKIEDAGVVDKVDTTRDRIKNLESELAETKDRLSKAEEEVKNSRTIIEKLNKIISKILKEYNDLHIRALLEDYYEEQ